MEPETSLAEASEKTTKAAVRVKELERHPGQRVVVDPFVESKTVVSLKA